MGSLPPGFILKKGWNPMKKHRILPIFPAAGVPTGKVLPVVVAAVVLVAVTLFPSCSINRMATSMVADALSSPGGSSVFSSDPDPELVKDALPFALKMYESLLEGNPEHRPLLESTAEGFISYANAFIHTPASRLGYDEIDRQKEMLRRAKEMYLRGRDYALRSLEVDYPGFREAMDSGEGVEQLREMGVGDVNALYWAAAGWMGAISAAGFDTGMLMTLPRPVVLAARALEIDETYGDGSIHNLFIDIYGGVPAEQMLFGSSPAGEYAQEVLKAVYASADAAGSGPGPDSALEARARFHFRRAVELSEGQMAGPYVSLAESVVVQSQDAGEYRRLLEEALAIDADKYPEHRLLNLLTQEKARWLLKHMEDKFLILDELPEG